MLITCQLYINYLSHFLNYLEIMIRKIICLLLTLSFFTACQEESLPVEMLHGKWKLAQAYENHKLKELGDRTVLFHFDENGRYSYGSESMNAEAGPYYIKGTQLHTKDTLNPQAIKKAVAITLLSSDSLHLDMNRGGVPQLWKLVRN